MKPIKLLIYVLVSIFLGTYIVSCKTSSYTQAEIETLNENIVAGNYTFIPRTAIPTSMRTINLDGRYSLKVSKDTITADLPYYGVAYRAPYPGGDGGISFVSTEFDYNLQENKKGDKEIDIEIKDHIKRYKLYLSIGKDGYASLTVSDPDRQSISFFGKIE